MPEVQLNSPVLPKPSALNPYSEAGWKFVKLHRYDAIRELPPTEKHPKGRILELGKAPMGKAWVKEGISYKEALAHMNSGRNVGALIPPGWAVVDVDPRNFKNEDDSFARFQKDTGFVVDNYPAVRTGSGGWHVFCRIPESFKGVVKIDEYPGIEFKTIGTQVVSAGSIHPKTKSHYEWMEGSSSMKDAPEVPTAVLDKYRIQRPLISAANGGGSWGTLTPAQIAVGLDLLDVTNYRSQDDWFGLMCSVHWLSGGEARQEWIDWSLGDSEYADQGQVVATRWDSLNRDSSASGVAARGGQFFKALKTVGVQPYDDRFRLDISKCFTDITEEDIKTDEKIASVQKEMVREELYKSSDAIVEELNEKHFVLNYRGKTVIGSKRQVEDGPTSYFTYEFQDAASFKLYYGNMKLPDGVSYGEYWLAAPRRRTYNGFDFKPDEPPGSYLTLSGDLMLNQWTGFATRPQKGDWSLFQRVLFEAICKSDTVKYEYLLNWCADAYQNLRGPTGVAFAIKGKKGTGKTSFWSVFSRPFGPAHSLITAKMESVFGQHNGRMHGRMAIGLEEAYFAGSKMAEAQLKDLITGDVFGINEKFLPEYTQTNHSKIVIMTNDDWVVPATEDERRFFVCETSNIFKDDHEFWTAFRKQMFKEGGAEAFFYDMLHRDISEFNAYRDLPRTEELLGQIEITRGPVVDWLQERMTFGENGFSYSWFNNKGHFCIPKHEFWEDFKQWQINSPRGKYNSTVSSANAFSRELKRVLPDYEESTSVPPAQSQGLIKTFPTVVKGREYHITNVYKFASFEFLKNELVKKYAMKFQEIDADEILDSYDHSEDNPKDIWNLF